MRVIVTLLLLIVLLDAGCRREIVLTAPPQPTATPTIVPTPSPTPTPRPQTLAGWRDFLAAAEATRRTDRPALVNAYIARIDRAPLIEDTTAVFLFRSAAPRVRLSGDLTGWDPGAALDMVRLEGTELWYLERTLEPDARLDYVFLVGEEERADPLNPDLAPGYRIGRSALAMPAYAPPAALRPPADMPRGALQEQAIDSAILGVRRTFFVYVPPGQLIGAPRPALYLQDGGEWLTRMDLPRLLDALVAQRAIVPTVAVFIPPVVRGDDYAPGGAYADFVAQEVVPFVRDRYGTDPDPARTVTLGIGLGGAAAVDAAARYPAVFGRAAALSGAFMAAATGWPAPAGAPPPQLYLVVGSYEQAVSPAATLPGELGGDYLAAAQEAAAALRAAGYGVTLVQRPEGHSWGLWLGQVGPALRALGLGVGG